MPSNQNTLRPEGKKVDTVSWRPDHVVTFAPPDTIAPASYRVQDLFWRVQLSTTFSVTPSSLSSEFAFGIPQPITTATLKPASLTDQIVFGSPSVSTTNPVPDVIQPDSKTVDTIAFPPTLSTPATLKPASMVTVSTYGTPTVSTAPAGYVIPNRSASSDPMVRITPDLGGDKTACPDSTAGIQAYLDNETPSGAVVTLDFDVRCDGTLQLRGGRTLRSTDINSPHKIFRALILPWRVVPDTRATVGGVANPWYNPNARCSQWQYDWRGGQSQAFAAQPYDSTRNPYGMVPSTGAPKGSGDERGGYDVSDEHWLFTGDTPVSNPAYDQRHLKALPPVTVAGKTWAGYPAGPIWYQSDVGKTLRVLINTGANGTYNKTITSVDPDGRTVRWADNTGVIGSIWANISLLWVILDPAHGGSHGGWIVQFQPNPGYNPLYVNGTTQPSRYAFDWAITKCGGFNELPVINMAAGTSLIGVEVVGTDVMAGQAQTVVPAQADMPCRNALLNWQVSEPLTMEFAHGVITDGANPPTCKIDRCKIHHWFGDCHRGNVILTNSYLTSTGRQGMTLYWNGIRVDNCTFGDHKHSSFDLESGTPTNDVQFTNNCFGGPHGASVSTVVNNFVFTGNHSTPTDVSSGRIQSTCPPMRAANWGSGAEGDVGGQNWTISNNNFPVAPAQASGRAPSWVLCAVNGLTMRNNIGPKPASSQYFLQPEAVVGTTPPRIRCTNMTLSGNDGGPNMIGTGGNDSIDPRP